MFHLPVVPGVNILLLKNGQGNIKYIERAVSSAGVGPQSPGERNTR